MIFNKASKIKIASIIFFLIISTFFMPSISAPNIENDDDILWMKVSGNGTLSVIFINGNGSNTSVWDNIEPKVREMGVRTIIYDRAGLGNSPLKLGPYHIEDEAKALKRTLIKNKIDGPILLIAHSYGGLIATLFADNNPNIKGIIFIDALLPDDLGETLTTNVLEEYTPQFEALEKYAPKQAAALIPVVNAFPETAKNTQKITISPNVHFIDIIAETSWLSKQEDRDHINQVHDKFVLASPNRESVFAENSSHAVMQDRPDIVLEQILKMINHLKLRKTN